MPALVAAEGAEAPGAPDESDGVDSGLAAFVLLLRFLGKPADPAQLKHQFSADGEKFTAQHILRAAKALDVKARIEPTPADRLDKAVLPAIALLRDGSFALLARASADRVLLQDVSTGRPAIEQRAAFDARWSGELILVTTRERTVGAARPFDLTWFIPSIVRFRGLLGEALVGSLFLQLFALITPLFTQVVIDKVLVHKGWSTLDVLVFGLVVISLFQVLLDGLRAYVLAHTTNRIDVELGARLFRHLTGLPLAYFSVRRVGDSVARVRELENIRQFLTGQALTIGIDTAFAFVFVLVMWLYSWQLTVMVLAAIPFWAAIVIVAVPIWRRRLDEKFDRGAENQAFLVESVTGIETVKAMAIEPQMQRRWEDKLAAYVTASFKVTKLAVVASHAIDLISNQLAEIKAGGQEIDSGVAQLVEAMATYSANNPGFNPQTAMQMPNDTNLQTVSASSWHH